MKDLSKQQYNNYRTIRRIILSLFLLIIVLISGYLIYLYVYIESEKTVDFHKTEQRVMNETLITEIIDTKRLHVDKYYHIVFGLDDLANEYIAFVEQSENDEIVYIDTADIIQQQNMINLWQSNCESCELIRIIPAMLDDDILWEITYIDTQEKYVIDYYSIYRGDLHEQIKLLQIFK